MSAVAPALAPLPPLIPPAQPVETIRGLLRREVAMVLKDAMPALTLVPVEKVYDHVMADPILLEQAFRVLRAQPELFKDIITTPTRTMPQSDTDALWCGRTLAEGIALVVRACARRYFKQRLKAKNSPRCASPTSVSGARLAFWSAWPNRPAR